MKKTIVIMVAIAAIALIHACSGTKSSTGSASPSEVEQLLGERTFRIDVNRIMPLRGRAITTTDPWSLEVKGDSVYSYLPYYGRAYNIPYGGGEGMSFRGIAEDYRSAPGQKNATDISFRVRTREAFYDFSIEVFPNGRAYITVLPNNKQTISYDGQIGKPEEK